MAKLDDPMAGAQKWATKMGQAGPAYEAGVDGVTTAPGILAARQSAKYLARVQENVGKFERNVASVTLGDWQAAAKAKSSRLGPGATAALPKVQAFTQAFYTYLKNGQNAIKSMPTDTFDQAMQKAYAQADYNRKFPGYR